MREKPGNNGTTRRLMLGVASLSLMYTQAAFAQQSQPSGDPSPQVQTPEPVSAPIPAGNEIIVTGSRLSQKAVSTQPIQSFTGASLTDLGYTNVGQALTALPGFGVPGNSTVGGQGSYSAGQTFANLYDLGSQRTLTLVNGNRFVSSASSSLFGPVQGSPVDLGQISPSLVDHIDVVSVGGAPIYGSDAIAGTVNVILKRNYQGLELDVSDAISQHGDAGDYNISLLAGKNFAEDRGNITINIHYDHQDGLTDAQRNITSANGPFEGYNPNGISQYQYYATGGFRYPVFTNTGMPMFADSIPIFGGAPVAAITNAAGQALYFSNQGHLVPFTDGIPLANGLTEVGGNGFGINNYGNLMANTNRIQGTLLGRYDISDHLHFHGELWLSRDVGSNLADQPYYSTALFGPAGSANGNLVISTANPYLSAADQATIIQSLAAQGMPTNQFYMARANTDLESGSFRSRSDLFRIVGGLDGDFAIGSHKFTWETTLNFGQVTGVTTQRELVTQNFFNAIDAVSSGGSIQCAPGYTNATIATISSTCAPLNIFGLGNASQAAVDYVTSIAQTHQVDKQFDFVGDVKGDIAHLPGGNVKFVLGYEHRYESQSFDPGVFYRGELQSDGSYEPYGNVIPITAVAGSYYTNEGFGELQVPVVSPSMHVPLVHSLNLQGAARYTDNSLTGGFWSYTGGGTWEPTSAGLTFRGNYTRSFRAPSVTELFAPSGSVFELANDPCDARFIAGGSNPANRAANCAAAGVPAGFTSTVVDSTVQGVSGGNLRLQNEKADSWTAGAQFSPRAIPGLTLNADYVSIDILNEIADPGLTNEMDACYDSPNYPNSPYCNVFTRNPVTHQITSFTDNYTNIAIEHFRALQGSLSYRFPLTRVGLPESVGGLNLSVNYLHTFSHYYQVGEGQLTQVLSDATDPKNSFVANVDWMTKHFDWLWTVTYYGPTKVDPNQPAGTYEYPNVSPYWMADTSIGIKVNDTFSVRMIVNNVFNLGAPFPYYYNIYNSVGNTNWASKYFDGIMGRYFRVSAHMKF